MDSRLIFNELRPDMERHLVEKARLLEWVETHDFDVLIVLGAGDVVDYMPRLKQILEAK